MKKQKQRQKQKQLLRSPSYGSSREGSWRLELMICDQDFDHTGFSDEALKEMEQEVLRMMRSDKYRHECAFLSTLYSIQLYS